MTAITSRKAQHELKPSSVLLGSRATAAEVIDGVDLSDHHAMVTGGASGIVTETIRALATAGAEVTIATRQPAAGLSSQNEHPDAIIKRSREQVGDLARRRLISSARR